MISNIIQTSKNSYKIHYIHTNNHNTNINNNNLKNIIDHNFGIGEFPEYKIIAYDVYNFITKHILL